MTIFHSYSLFGVDGQCFPAQMQWRDLALEEVTLKDIIWVPHYCFRTDFKKCELFL